MDKRIPEQAQQLFVQVIDRMSGQGDPFEFIPEILKSACDFFRFGIGVVYQADHAGLLTLRESYVRYRIDLPIHVLLSSELTPMHMKQLVEQQAVVIRPDQISTGLEKQMKVLFSANTMVMIPIVDNNKSLMGLVGMFDRRSDLMLEDGDYEVAQSVMMVIANQVKLQMYQTRVDDSKRALENTMDAMGIDIYVNDFYTHEMLYANKSMAEPYGGWEKMKGKTCYEALYDDRSSQCDYCPQRMLVDESGNPTKTYSWDYQRPFDGAWFRVFSSAFRWADGRLAHVVSSVDITENKKNEEIIRTMAEYDDLTGLPNRRRFVEDIDQNIQDMLQKNEHGYVIFFDLDNFKRVNDDLGHRAGDELLQRVGAVLEDDELTEGHGYRHAGDEFVLAYQNIDFETLKNILDFILQSFDQPIQLEQGSAHCPASIGVAYFPTDGMDASELLHAADMAMYASKDKQGNNSKVHFYNRGDIISLCQMEEKLANMGDE